ncbi:MAG: Ig-like domain-containing protein [Candidatus Bathyarchaeota archaeon]
MTRTTITSSSPTTSAPAKEWRSLKLNIRLAATAILVIIFLSTASLSMVGVQVPPIGNYQSVTSKIASYMLSHPQESVDQIAYFKDHPDLLDWALQHSNELASIYSNDEAFSLLTSNPWLIDFLRTISTSDPEYFSELMLNPAKSVGLLKWLIANPGTRDILLNYPRLARRLVEGGYDKSIFISFVKIVFPLPNFLVFGSTPINLTAYSPMNITEVEAWWNSSEDSGEIGHWANRAGNISEVWDTNGRPPGVYTLNAYATTGNGSTLTDSVNVLVHTALHLQVEILSPLNGQTLSGTIPIVAEVINQSQVNRCYATLNGTGGNYLFDLQGPEGGGLYRRTVDTRTILDGLYHLSVVASGVAGFLNSSGVSITVHNIPRVTIVSPTNNSVLSLNFIVSANVSSADTVSNCSAILTNKSNFYAFSLIKIGGFYTRSVAVANVADGRYNLTVTAVDSQGFQGSSKVIVTVSTAPSLRIISPVNGESVYGNFTVSVQVSSLRQISWCRAVFDGRMFNLTDIGGTFSGTVRSYPSPEGVYVLEVRVTDVLGSSNSSLIFVKLDNVPDVTLISPLNDIFVQGNFSIQASVSSLYSVVGVLAYVDSVRYGNLTVSGGVYRLTAKSLGLAEGYHTIYVTALNSKGFTNSSSTSTIKVDNVASKVVVNTPLNGSTLTSPIMNLNVTIDDFTNWVSVYVGNVPVAYNTYGNAYVSSVSFEIDTSTYIFPYTNALLVTVQYESALGHTAFSRIIADRSN